MVLNSSCLRTHGSHALLRNILHCRPRISWQSWFQTSSPVCMPSPVPLPFALFLCLWFLWSGQKLLLPSTFSFCEWLCIFHPWHPPLSLPGGMLPLWCIYAYDIYQGQTWTSEWSFLLCVSMLLRPRWYKSSQQHPDHKLHPDTPILLSIVYRLLPAHHKHLRNTSDLSSGDVLPHHLPHLHKRIWSRALRYLCGVSWYPLSSPDTEGPHGLHPHLCKVFSVLSFPRPSGQGTPACATCSLQLLCLWIHRLCWHWHRLFDSCSRMLPVEFSLLHLRLSWHDAPVPLTDPKGNRIHR